MLDNRRRANTDTLWKQRLNIAITQGERFKCQGPREDNFDLERLHIDIKQWHFRTSDELKLTYKNPSISESFRTSILQVNIEAMNDGHAGDALIEFVTARLNELRDLRQATK